MEHHDTGLEHEAESVSMFFLGGGSIFLNHSCPILRALVFPLHFTITAQMI